jgi:hypothetical protein
MIADGGVGLEVVAAHAPYPARVINVAEVLDLIGAVIPPTATRSPATRAKAGAPAFTLPSR